MQALILVDLQNDFLPGGALAVPRGDEVIPVANQLQEYFDLVIATKDWHPADHGSFASNHPDGEVGEMATLAGQPQVLWPDHCVQGTPGSLFAPDLDTSGITRFFFKGTGSGVDSYSAFFDNAALRATGLGDYLEQAGVDEIYILGLATDYCVKFTALDAVNLGFEVHVVADGCRAVNLRLGDESRAFQELRDAGVDVMWSSEIVVPEPIAAYA